MNLDDARFCASCGVALSREHLHHPGLAALVDGEETPTVPSVDVAPTAATAPPSGSPGADPTVRRPEPPDPDATVRAPGGAGTDATVQGAATPPPAGVTTTHATVGPPAAGPPTATAGPRAVGNGRPPWVLPTALVGIVLVLATIVLIVVATRSGDDAATTTAAPVTDPTVTDGGPTTVPATDPPGTTQPTETTAPDTTTPGTTAPETTTPPTSPPDAATQLVEIANDDLPQALALRDRWVPQLSAKEDGTVWEGVTYDLPGILALHEQLSERVGGALLVEGSSLAFLRDGERMAGWWFTLADVDFDDADTALEWCVDEGFTRENCAARLVTDQDDATGTLRLRPEPSE